MESNNSPPHQKFRKQIQQVMKLKILVLCNVVELTYDCNKGRGCKTKGHGHCQFDKFLNILNFSYEKTLNFQYFNKLFSIDP
jgi:hypothetical protein